MNPARRLAEAVGSWLHLEFCCYRAGLFSEGALKAVVGQMLSSFPISKPGVRVYADFAHDALNPLRRPGRKKEVDFALILSGRGLPKSDADILVEVKWANSSHCTIENIFTDFLRLAILKRADPNATCIFLLAGTSSALLAATDKMPFKSSGNRNTGIGRSGAQKRAKLDFRNFDHRTSYSNPIKALAADGFVIPKDFVTCAYDAHPIQSEGGTVDFQARAWEILAVATENIDKSLWC